MDTQLSPEQRCAVEAPLQSCLVLAGPGTGKTRTLAHRAVYAVSALNVPPAAILAVTYTNKATEEMRDRLRRFLPDTAGHLTVGTFHGFCIQLLRQYPDKVGLPKHFGVADEKTQVEALLRLKPGIQPSNARTILGHFSQCRVGDRRRPTFAREQYAALRQDNPLFAEYEDYLRRNALIDFDDILLLTERLLDDADVLAVVRQRLQMILVDEFQDTDRAQYAILKRLALDLDPPTKARHNVIPVFAVADDDQSIFAWRGAHPENIHQFFTEFLGGQDAAVFRLETNYRCSGNIVAAANRLMRQSPRLFDKTPRAHHPPGEAVRLCSYVNAAEEIRGIAAEIRHAHYLGVPFSEMAVLYRYHKTGEALEAALLPMGIPCQVVRRVSVYEAPEVKRFLLLMRATLNPDDDLAVAELIGVLTDDATRRTFEQRCQPLKTAKQPLRHALWVALGDEDAGLRRAAGRVVSLLSLGKTYLDSAPCLSAWIAAVGAFFEPDAAQPPALTPPADDLHKGVNWLARLSEVGGALVVAASAPLHEKTATYLLTYTLAGQAGFQILPRSALGDALPKEKTVLLALDATAMQAALARWKFTAVITLGNQLGPLAQPARAHLRIATDTLPVSERGGQPSGFVVLWKLARAYLAHTLRPLFRDYTVVDLETTDKDPKRCDIVELAAVRVRDGNLTDASYSTLVHPTLEPISPGAQATHHITPEDVAGAPTFAEVAADFRNLIGNDLLVAHNGLAFDFPILKRRLREVGHTLDNPLFDTLLFARQLYAGHPTVKRFRLEDLAALHGIDTGTAHRALDDVKTLAGVFERLQADYNERRSATLGTDTLGILALAMLLEMDEAQAEASDLFQSGAAMWKTSGGGDLMRWLADDPAGSHALAVWRRRVGAAAGTPLSRPAMTLAALAKRYDDLPVREGMTGLLDFTRLFTAADTWRDCDAVTLMTIHAAKGLEFAYVWLPALEEPQRPNEFNGAPSKPSSDKEAKQLEEERRLLYVAVTRAERQLSLSWAAQRSAPDTGSLPQPTQRLRFLAELDCQETRFPPGEDGFVPRPDLT
ncbi:MAG: UvrD-helicase domain-containing protein [Chloracidobacterium sp.]|uniref:DNA 3'-5' helicase n=1 Tax=Chloracidobacterium validum TaxID=2821543 RepID=A0ABX8B5U9_9BACT|nr:UvrD-helicase domain-containing protein [Chloracidobacterium validum]QUW02029.1 UvrD-helicase domain-containing protein [Chloracidobacterium validum]